MAAHRSGMENIIRRMIANGKSSKEIKEWTGVSYKTIARYRDEMSGGSVAVEKKIHNANYPPGFRREWTLAVNRIRKYCGKELFPMPEEKEDAR